jgi:large subunit ribosomal protein L18
MIQHHSNSRLKRARKSRAIIARSEKYRLSIFKTARHIYSQITTPDGSNVICAASSNHPSIRQQVRSTGNIHVSILVGRLIASEASKAGVSEVAFDRAGFKYHGRIKALADAARDAGLQI